APPSRSALSPLSLHDALPIYARPGADDCRRLARRGDRARHHDVAGLEQTDRRAPRTCDGRICADATHVAAGMARTLRLLSIESRSEEHTSELQSRSDLVCSPL